MSSIRVRLARLARSGAAARAVTYGSVAVIAAAAISSTPPAVEPTPAASVASGPVPVAAPPAPTWRERTDTLARGESLSRLLERVGLRGPVALSFLREATGLDARRLPAGMLVTSRALGADSIPSEVVFRLSIDRAIRALRTDSGWVSRDERLPWTTDTIVVQAAVASTLYEALGTAATALTPPARAELAWTVADIFEYRVDMSRDLQPGDSVRVLLERARGPGGATRVGDILAASVTVGGDPIEAFRHEVAGYRGRYYDAEGKSLRAAFLRAPLAFRRISSVFGMRKHPILGTWRAHKGTDYAAASGTPIRSIGDGVVAYAGRRSGYGNVVEIRHRNGFVSRYGHVRAFARGVRRGARVGIGETIAYVGMTGLATAPHLHFEVLVGGVQRNPRVALAMKGGEPLPAAERRRFQARRETLLALLERTGDTRSLAARD